MSKNELQKIWDCEIDLPYKEKVEELQRVFSEQMNIDVEHNNGKVVYPTFTKYNHYFSDGLYAREMFCQKDALIFTLLS